MNFNQIPNRVDYQDPDNNKNSGIPKSLVGQVVLKSAVLIVLISVLALAIFLLSFFTQAVGHEAEGFFRHITRLFRNAPYMFRSPRGFGAFVQLILIAVFVGWTIRRFMDRSKK